MGRFNSLQSEISWDHAMVERPISGEMTWQVPSNLALVKYWGKVGHQLPGNPSLSLTLRQSVTVLEAHFSFDPQTHQDLASLWTFQFSSDENNSMSFGGKIFQHLEIMSKYYSFLRKTKLILKSHNTFPHSAGIASSASASLSIALLVEGLATLIRGEDLNSAMNDQMFLRRASFLARLGSGSASRSVFPIGALWGACPLSKTSSDEWGVGVEDELPYLRTVEDMILIVDQRKKRISSREGHELMDTHPYRKERYARAGERLNLLWQAIKSGKGTDDFHRIGVLIEAEALDLHSLMMSSTPPVVLMCPDTLAIILALWEWRMDSKAPVYFTLDAGPNIHLLYPKSTAAAMVEFKKILKEKNLLPQQIIEDGAGQGPQLLLFKIKQ
ncbi:MAG: diphosphomevalonate decarboxylase [Bdellovibrio sp.]|nr:diphosphomevalonate decarboxylase [Bdellovibrio sp.]